MNIRERFISYANLFYRKSKIVKNNMLYENVLDAYQDKLTDRPILYEIDLTDLDPYPDIFNTDEYPETDPNLEAEMAQLDALMAEQLPYLSNFFVHFPTQNVLIRVDTLKSVDFSFVSGEVVVTLRNI